MKEYHRITPGPQGGVLSRPVRPSFRDLLKHTREQLQLNTFVYRDRALAEELCSIIAEVYFLAVGGDGSVRIEGEPIPYGLVRDIYEFLTAEHLEYVIERYRSVTTPIRNTKAYLRTALYNAVFELELSGENEFRSDYIGGGV